MNYQDKTKEELILELEEIKRAHDALKVSVAKDMDQRRQVEEALRHSENKYRLLAMNSSDVIWTMDNNYNFTYVSPSIFQLRGLTPEEAMQESFQDTMPPKSQQIVFEAISKGKENARKNKYFPSLLELEQYRKDGSLVHVETSIRAMINDKGEKIGYVGSSRNITQRKIAQNKLNQSLEHFNSLITKIPVGIYVFWIRANGHMEFEYVSDRWCELHKIKRDEVLNDVGNVNKLIHKDDIDNFLFLNRQAARNHEKFVWEGRIIIANELRWFRIESIPVRFENNDVRWHGVSKDITERKKAEIALRENEKKLRVSNAQKDKFFSIIAHDLRSPFNAIMGLSELLADQVSEKNYEGIDEYAHLIKQSSHLSMDLLTNLFQWSQSQTGRIAYNPEIFDLGDLIKENQRLLTATAGQKAITISKVLSHKIAVSADKQMINTVLRNLISNAIKFTNEGGEITITAEKRAEDILVSVHDNGIGISKERLKTLFQIDESYSTLGTNNEKGTGLGIILCMEFVEKHGGKIWAESEEGKGTIFYFTLSAYPKVI